MVNIFKFLNTKKGYNIPLKYKLLNNLPLTDEELTVKGDLDLSFTNITNLPDNLTINGTLDLTNTKISKLPKNLRTYTLLMDNTNIEEIHDTVLVVQTLSADKTPLKKISDNFRFPKTTTDISNTNITSLPKNIITKRLYIENTQITEIPENLNVKDLFYLDKTPLISKYKTLNNLKKEIIKKGGIPPIRTYGF